MGCARETPKRKDEQIATKQWVTVERPGYFGKHQDAKRLEYDKQYGMGNWRIVLEVNRNVFIHKEVALLYKDSYYFFLRDNPDVLQQLINEVNELSAHTGGASWFIGRGLLGD